MQLSWFLAGILALEDVVNMGGIVKHCGVVSSSRRAFSAAGFSEDLKGMPEKSVGLFQNQVLSWSSTRSSLRKLHFRGALARKHRCCGTNRSFLAGSLQTAKVDGLCQRKQTPRKSSECALKHPKKATKTKKTPKKHTRKRLAKTQKSSKNASNTSKTPRKCQKEPRKLKSTPKHATSKTPKSNENTSHKTCSESVSFWPCKSLLQKHHCCGAPDLKRAKTPKKATKRLGNASETPRKHTKKGKTKTPQKRSKTHKESKENGSKTLQKKQ